MQKSVNAHYILRSMFFFFIHWNYETKGVQICFCVTPVHNMRCIKLWFANQGVEELEWFYIALATTPLNTFRWTEKQTALQSYSHNILSSLML